MTLQHIKYLLTIVETGSITEAANKLYISQPSLSNALKDIEKEAGFQIFVRNRSGIALTRKGQEFLGYVRAVSQQMDLLESRFFKHEPEKVRFAVSTQHFTFTANAFVEMVHRYGEDKYEFILNETQTWQIIQDVKNRYSDLGVLYLSSDNRKVLKKAMIENDIESHPVFTAHPHIFVYRENPLAKETSVNLDDLKPYPKLSYIQGDYESEYFAEEPFSTIDSDKVIRVSDRGSIVNMMIGLNGYTISSGIYPSYLHGQDIVSVPLKTKEQMEIVYLTKKNEPLSALGQIYIEELQKYQTF